WQLVRSSVQQAVLDQPLNKLLSAPLIFPSFLRGNTHPKCPYPPKAVFHKRQLTDDLLMAHRKDHLSLLIMFPQEEQNVLIRHYTLLFLLQNIYLPKAAHLLVARSVYMVFLLLSFPAPLLHWYHLLTCSF